MSWWPRREREPSPSPADLLGERLSAYLDDELPPADRAAVEAELAASEEARKALDDLRMVRQALSSLEIVRAPRSFALAAPPAPSRAGLFSRLELAIRAGSLVAAFAFVVAIAGGSSLSVTTPAIPGMSEAFTALEAPPADLAAEPEPLRAGAAADDADAPVTDAPPAPADADAEDGFGTLATPDADRPDERSDAVDAPSEAEERAELRGPADPADSPIAMSEAPGGAAAALGVIAVLLGLLSLLLARQRRTAA